MTASDYLDLLIKALLLAGIYAAMAVGMTVIYGVMKIVNLAHAGFLMLGAYFAFELFQRFQIDPVLGAVRGVDDPNGLAARVEMDGGLAAAGLREREVPGGYGDEGDYDNPE